MLQDAPDAGENCENCENCENRAWMFHGYPSLVLGVFPSCRQGAGDPAPASCLLREQGACQEHPQHCYCPRTSTEGASNAKLSKSGIQHQSHGLQAHVLMHKWLSSALDGFHQPAGFSLPASSPRVLHYFTPHTGKQKQKETPWFF